MDGVAADEVARLLNGSFELGEAGSLRPLEAGDIAVIVDSHRQGQTCEQALRERNIACIRKEKASVFESAAAQTMRRWLMALLEPRAGGRMRVWRWQSRTAACHISCLQLYTRTPTTAA